MFDHVGIRVKDFDGSVRFYTAALAPLGYGLCSRDDKSAGFGPSGEPALWIYAAKKAGAPLHLAFQAKNRAAVERFHAAAVAAGARDHGLPGVRGDYGPTYYAAFVLDLDGNNVEAVCTK